MPRLYNICVHYHMEQCYLCGERLVKKKNKSRDHVPPDCIFPKEKPANLITIPCCISCNQKFKPLDEKMRNFIALLSGEKSGEVGEVAKKEILRSSRLSMEFLSYTKDHPSLRDSEGTPRLLFFFDDKELELWLSRIVKGLFFHREKRRISDNAIYRVIKHSELTPQPSMTFPLEEGLELRPYFVYGVVQEANTGHWVLIFYDHIIFSVIVEVPGA